LFVELYVAGEFCAFCEVYDDGAFLFGADGPGCWCVRLLLYFFGYTELLLVEGEEDVDDLTGYDRFTGYMSNLNISDYM